MFTVAGHRYDVRLVPVGDPMPQGVEHAAFGASNHHEDYIVLRAIGKGGLSVHQQIDTFLHEVLHSIAKTSGIGASMGATQEEEEAIISALTPQLLLFLRSNPRVVDYLMGPIA